MNPLLWLLAVSAGIGTGCLIYMGVLAEHMWFGLPQGQHVLRGNVRVVHVPTAATRPVPAETDAEKTTVLPRVLCDDDTTPALPVLCGEFGQPIAATEVPALPSLWEPFTGVLAARHAHRRAA